MPMKKLDEGSAEPSSTKSKSATKSLQGASPYAKMESERESVDIVSNNTNSISPRDLANKKAQQGMPSVATVATTADVALHVEDSNLGGSREPIASSEGQALEMKSARRSVSQLEHVGKYVVLEELGSGSQAIVYKCAVSSEYKNYMNLKYPSKKKKKKADEHKSTPASDVGDRAAASPTTPPTCEFFAMKIVKKKSILRRRKRHRELLNSNKTIKGAKEKIGKYGYATGKVAKEIAILKRLNHENIVKIIDVLDNPDEDKLYVVMEYLPSGALLPDWRGEIGHCDINPLSEETVRVIYRDIALAMLYMHTHNVVHRDIKPSNILMSRSGVGHGGAKLADFGVAHIFADDNENVEDFETFVNAPMIGTPMFCPPESFSPRSKRASLQSIDSDNTDEKDDKERRKRFSGLLFKHQSGGDVWSFGVSLYLSVMGRPPFVGETFAELSHNIQTKPLLFNFENAPVVSTGLKTFLGKLLHKDIRKRPSASEILKDPWMSMDGILPSLSLTKKESEPIEVEEKEISEALTLVMKTMEVVSFSTRWLMHARREITSRNEHKDNA